MTPEEFWRGFDPGVFPWGKAANISAIFDFTETYASRVTAGLEQKLAQQVEIKKLNEQQVASLTKERDELEKDLNAERIAHEQIGDILLPIVGTGHGTSVDAARRARVRVESLTQERDMFKRQSLEYCDGYNKLSAEFHMTLRSHESDGYTISDLRARAERLEKALRDAAEKIAGYGRALDLHQKALLSEVVPIEYTVAALKKCGEQVGEIAREALSGG